MQRFRNIKIFLRKKKRNQEKASTNSGLRRPYQPCRSLESVNKANRDSRNTPRDGGKIKNRKGGGESVGRIFLKIMTSGCQLATAYRCNPW